MSLSSQLQDYLSSKGGRSSGVNNGFSFFGRRESSTGVGVHSSQLDDDGDSGWFASAQSDPLFPSLTKKQRALGFIGCILMGTFCISLASLYIPFLVFKARKFAMLYTMGSLFIIARYNQMTAPVYCIIFLAVDFSVAFWSSRFALLWGPVSHLKHLLSPSRLPFTASYFGTMFGTLYFSLSVQSTVLTIIFALLQVMALVWFVVSYVPGGQTGLTFFSKIFYVAASKTVQKTLPV